VPSIDATLDQMGKNRLVPKCPDLFGDGMFSEGVQSRYVSFPLPWFHNRQSYNVDDDQYQQDRDEDQLELHFI
jgi:hypothetical protein